MYRRLFSNYVPRTPLFPVFCSSPLPIPRTLVATDSPTVQYVVPFASTRSTSQSFLASTPLITKNNVLVHPAGSTRPIDSLEWDNEENNRLVRIFVYRKSSVV